VVIATPNHVHEGLATRALRGGKHVLVERPMALTGEGVERVAAAAEESGRSVMVGLPHRYRPELVALKSFVEEGQLGDVYAVRASWLTRHAPPMRPTWKERRAESGGGALIPLGVPALDICLWLVGHPRVRSVRALLSHGDFEVEDAATLVAETENGIAISVEVSSRHFAAEDRFHARVMGREGSGTTPPLEIYRRLGGRPLNVTPRQPKPRGGENPYMNAYRRQIDHFVRCVGAEAEVDPPREQAELMRLIQAAYRSAEIGSEVVP
jgi:predicted dehydrogenase